MSRPSQWLYKVYVTAQMLQKHQWKGSSSLRLQPACTASPAESNRSHRAAKTFPVLFNC